jgi:hypothetical protein
VRIATEVRSIKSEKAEYGKQSDAVYPPSLVRFANFVMDLRAGKLRKDASKVRLQEQPFLVLTALSESAGKLSPVKIFALPIFTGY